MEKCKPVLTVTAATLQRSSPSDLTWMHPAGFEGVLLFPCRRGCCVRMSSAERGLVRRCFPLKLVDADPCAVLPGMQGVDRTVGPLAVLLVRENVEGTGA